VLPHLPPLTLSLSLSLTLARVIIVPERHRRRRSSSPPLLLDDKPPPELHMVVGVIAVPSLRSLLPSRRGNSSLEQPSRASPWCAPLRPLHCRPEPSIEFVVISSRSQAKSCEKSRSGTPDSVNSGASAAARRQKPRRWLHRAAASLAPPNPLSSSDPDPMFQIQSNSGQSKPWCFCKRGPVVFKNQAVVHPSSKVFTK
jgi:hypothetical protein